MASSIGNLYRKKGIIKTLMKADLDRLMQKYNIDVLFVIGGEEASMIRNYMLNGADATAWVIKKRGEEPVVIAGSQMEVDGAKKSGHHVYTRFEFGLADFQKQFKNDLGAVERALFESIFKTLDLRGRVGFYGTADVMRTVWLLSEVIPTLPGVELVHDFAASELFQEAYSTKDADEIAKLKEAGRLASEVVAAVWEFIAGHRADADGNLVDTDGKPLTIGDVKRFVRMQNFERGLENAEGMIFAQGRDGATGHGAGEDPMILRTGQAIVFDYFPRMMDNGYFHDLTRTWCIGYAPPEIQALYDQVMIAFNTCQDSLKVGDPGSRYQNMVNDYFESLGHKTSRTHPGATDGYFHSLGHGVGLNVHEAPWMRNYPYGEPLGVGSVFTLEPGLYYPDLGYGMRIEDTVYFDSNGVLQNLTDFKYDLVLKLHG